MDWKLIERCWRILNARLGQLWEFLSGGNFLILRPVPVLEVRRQLSRGAHEIDPPKSLLDPNRFQLD